MSPSPSCAIVAPASAVISPTSYAGATSITGMSNFGLPAFEKRHGDVVFSKDHKTLWVDATRLQAHALPDGVTRQGVAYGVAAAVVACWTE